MSEPGLNVITSAITGLVSVIGTGPFGTIDLPAADRASVLGTGEAAWIARVSTKGQPDMVMTSDHSSGLSISLYPKNFLNAVLAAEDGRFQQHGGADPIGIASAAMDTIRGTVRGGSSITQQLMKNAVVGNDATAHRKMAELVLSERLETSASKGEVLEAYLRHAWFGRGSRGAAQAAQTWFGKGWDDLTLAENATLAAMLKGPGRFDPEKNPTLVKGRRDAIITKMETYGWVSPEEAELARGEDVVVIPRSAPPVGDHWVISAIRRGAQEYATRHGVRGEEPQETVLTSTIDQRWQKAAREAIGAGDLPPSAEAALVVISVPDGDLLATIGGVDAERSGYDRTAAMRQPGSLSKPLFYGAALDLGLTPWSPVRNDRIDWGDGWDPGNYDGTQSGPAPLYQGLEASSNLMTIHLADSVPIEDLFRTAEMSGAWPLGGIRPFGPSLLGATETTLRRITSGLAGLANGGATVPLRTFEEDAPPRQQFLSPASSDAILAMMRGVMRRGTASVAGKGAKVAMAGKTGTSQDYRDAWFVGLTPHIAIGVWVGRDDDKSLGDSATGGVVSSRIAIDALNRALAAGLIDERGFVPGQPIVAHAEWPPELIGSEEDWGGGQVIYVQEYEDNNHETEDGLPPVFGSGDTQVDAFLEQVQGW